MRSNFAFRPSRTGKNRGSLQTAHEPASDKIASARSPRKRLTREQRRLIWEHIDTQYGLPRHCYVESCSGKPTLDHRDGNRNNNHIDNFRPACPRHQRPPVTVVNNSVSVRSGSGDAVGPSDNLVAVRERYQAALDNWLRERIGPGGPHRYLPVAFVEREASFDLHVSSVTIHRYIVYPGEMVASNAPYRLVEIVLLGDRPGRPTKCITWRGRKIDDEISATEGSS